ncbi:hypothetical protein QBE52_17185 [Clostridiaceae bacterium 35-E11]
MLEKSCYAFLELMKIEQEIIQVEQDGIKKADEIFLQVETILSGGK